MALITFSRSDFILEIVCPWEKHDCTTSLIGDVKVSSESTESLAAGDFYQDWSFTFEKHLSQ